MGDSEALIFRYPAPSREKQRDKLFNHIETWVAEQRGDAAASRLRTVRQTIASAEAGYRQILRSLKASPFSAMAPDEQLWGGIARGIQELDHIRQTANFVAGRPLGEGLMGESTSGHQTDLDGATYTFSQFCTVLIGMLARQNNWVQPDGSILFPEWIESSEAALDASSEVVDLGVSWSRWTVAETRARLWNGVLLEREAGAQDRRFMPGALTVRVHQPGSGDVVDWVAFQRLAQVTAQSFGELLLENRIADRIGDSDGPVELPPRAFMSILEASSAGLLFDMIALDPRDGTAYHGCSLMEWIRGYALLSDLAHKAQRSGSTPSERGIVRLTRLVLKQHLIRVGLGDLSADAFIANTSMHLGSDDLFDCPLLALEAGDLILVTPVAAEANPARVALSNLTRLDQRFEAKGQAFEKRVHRFFADQGLETFTIKTTRERQSYEIDVLLTWGDYLFVFECKNRGPSNLKPRLAYNQARDRREFRDQIKRQIDGLLRYPDMLTSISGIDPREKTIVPVVLYSLPVADDGDDSVCFYDWSALTRFFKSRYVSLKQFDVSAGEPSVLREIPLLDLWGGDAPTPERFAHEVRLPFQTRLMLTRLEPFSTPMRFSDTTFGVTTEWNLGDFDPARFAAFFREEAGLADDGLSEDQSNDASPAS